MIDIGQQKVEIQCPRCNFYNPIYLKQARLRDVVICRGCKMNIQLHDEMNQVRKAERSLRKQFDQLTSSLDNLNITINL